MGNFGRMVLSLLGLSMVLAVGAGCEDNPLYCNTAADCTDPFRPYCDLTGQYDPEHLGHSCVPDPFGEPDAGIDVDGGDGSVDPLCGNGAIDGEERCDGTELNGHSCVEQGFASGDLACSNGCKLDTSGCVAPPGCGDGQISQTEDCDGSNLGGGNCLGLGYAGGTLSCTGACLYDTTHCTYCGNDTIQRDEECDGTNLNGMGCGSLPGFQEGTLACTDTCTYDTSACISCGDAVAEGNEQCDGVDLGGNSCTTIGQGYIDGTLGCRNDCTFDTADCVAPPNCPNGTINSGEDCDPPALGNGTCATETAGVRPSGQLTCGDGCQYDASGCYACGDALVQGPEVCDGTNFAGVTCQSLGHDGGNLTCANTCLSRSEASCSDCGDNQLESPEICDGTQLGGADCTTVGDFSGGTLACNASCAGYNTTGCFGPPTVPLLKRPLANAYLGTMHTAGTRKPVFEWKASTVQGGGAIRYDLQYSTDPTFGTSVTSVDAATFTSFQPGADLAGATAIPVGARYWWRVRACKAAACSAYSTGRLLNIGRSDNDFNGDGYADLAVDAPYTPAGKVYVYLGPALSTSNVVTINGVQNSEEFGTHLAVGDWNGDGFSDLATGATGNDAAFTDAGQVRVYLGAATFNATADRIINGPAASAHLGSAVANLDDVNGDGFDDLGIGLSGANNSSGTTGRSDIFFGGAGTAFDNTVDASLPTPASATSLFGSGLTGADLNCDGYADVVEGGSTGTVYYGASGSAFDGVADVILGPNDNTSRLVVAVGDVNADGCADVLRRYTTSGGTESARIALGSSSGGLGSLVLTPPTTTDTSPTFAAALSGVGDVNGDGFADVLVGSAGDSGGKALVYFGGMPMNGTLDATFTSELGLTGDRVAGGGDVNGDGLADVAIAANIAGASSVFVLFGGTTFNVTADKTLNSPAPGDWFGDALGM